ncbi:SusC/RagA family TonB-linked outer membrane protein [Flavobacterium sp. GA093]|uniref:SusC/RagA family TonB-linked outer membrane protein n=1 Tax=Flavobacterium hydrocarbonoxydans TaxID=2683249 RepID=A0A6I4NNE5_9FLAO|nr:TonB-dependent receptor [Flavobacterium hydrocarbonoxydans]MWB95936.1 SusC/RagA family TonB-linked outer membrane protein [Flavobacterium hydrocarbonoxydans]
MKKSNKLLHGNYQELKFSLKAILTVLFLIVTVFKVNATTSTESSEKSEIVNKKSEADITIKGVILDELGQPMIGVTILPKGSKRGTTTDFDGTFTIVVPATTEALLLSYVGYDDKEVAIAGRTNITVSMVPSSKSLNEVVIIGYGTQKKKNVTGAMSSIKGESLILSSAPSVLTALQGKVAGLQITQNSAQPGGGFNIQIRGAGSINVNKPLVVIDGFPVTDFQQPGTGNRYDGGTQSILNSFNPNDIESIEVLKDASASAIYGARAANGVIMITTKKGKEGQVRVDYSGSYSYQKYNDSYEVLNLQEWMQLRNDASKENWEFINKVYPYSSRTLEEANAAPVNGIPFKRLYSDEQIRNAGKGTDWLSLVTRDGMVQQNNLSLRGGTQSTKYFLSGNLFNQEGIVNNSGLKRSTVHFSIDQKVTDYVNVGMNMTKSRIKNQNSQLGGDQFENSGIIRSAIQQSPNILAIDEFGNYPINPDNALEPNPYSLLTISDEGIIDRNLMNFYAEIKPFRGFTARFQAGFDQGNTSRNTYLPRTTLHGALENGKASINNQKKDDNLFDIILTYNTKIADDNSFTFMAGYSRSKFRNEGSSLGNSNFITDAFLWNNMNAGAGTKLTTSFKSEEGFISYFSRISYSYKDKYLLTSTIRRDGGSMFAENYKYALFPSISAGWDISQESFMKGITDYVSQLKVRFGYGLIGNSDGLYKGAFYAQPAYLNPDESIWTGVFPSRLTNPNLKWETTTEKNLGIDFQILKSRVSGSVELYDRVVSDLIQVKPNNSYQEIPEVFANIGSTQSRGVEVTLSTVNINNPDFKWNTTFTYSQYKTKWKERAPDWKPSVYMSYNDPLRAQYSQLSDGIMQIGEVVPAQPDLYPGQIKIKDINGFVRDAAGNPVTDENGVFLRTGEGDGKIDEADTVLLGSADPDFSAGLSNTIIWKNFQLNFVFNGMFGREIVDQTDFAYGVTAVGVAQNGRNALRNVYNRWTPENPTNTRPGSHFGYTQYGSGDFFMQDASFVRLQSVSLSYNLPQKWFGKYMQGAAIRLDGQNLFTITKYDGIDPETDAYAAAYPNVKTFTVGIDLKF